MEHDQKNRQPLNSDNVEIIVRLIRPGSSYMFDLFDEFGNCILEAHSQINEPQIKHLLSAGINSLFYNPASAREGETAVEQTAPQIIEESMKIELTGQAKSVFEHVREIYNLRPESAISRSIIDETRALVSRLLDMIDKNKDGVFSSFTGLKSHDDYTYEHSMNVAVLSAAVASKLDLKEEIKMAMGLGGLFHDLGKASISGEILNKIEKLREDEFDLIREHPHVGYKLVEKNTYMKELEKRIILLHHEKADGTGYPFGLSSEHYQNQIPREVRFLSMCDVFVALTSERPGGVIYTPREALRQMLNMVYAPYKKVFTYIPADFRDFVRAVGFMINRGESFISRGDVVRLNSGEIAVIEDINRLYPLNPRVKVIKDSKLQNMKRPVSIDMLKSFQSYIGNVFDRSRDSGTGRQLSVQKVKNEEQL
jgi:putative nucleotidyltransferase with HDIG domain